MRGAFEYFFAFLLGDAAEDSEFLALFEELLVIVEAVENFLLGFVPDGAGVIEDQVGLLDGLYLPVAFVNERANDFFGVVHIHLAAEGFQVEGFVRVPRHTFRV